MRRHAAELSVEVALERLEGVAPLVPSTTARLRAGAVAAYVTHGLPVLGAAALVQPGRVVALGSALLWLGWSLSYLVGLRPSAFQAAQVLRAGFLATAAVSMGSVAGALSSTVAAGVMLVLVTGTLSTTAAGLMLRRAAGSQRLVLVGDHDDVEMFATKLASRRRARMVGACVLPSQSVIPIQRQPLAVPTVSSVDDVPRIAGEVAADHVIVLPSAALPADELRRLTWAMESEDVTVGIACATAGAAAHRLETRTLADQAVLTFRTAGGSAAQRLTKAVLDRCLAAVLLLVASPLLALMWVAVKVDSKGRGLFVQERAGRHGHPFRMYKMRTMHQDAEAQRRALAGLNESDGVLFKIRRDPRITRVGRWLRKSSLDELPQLLNVLRGEMSLIGPRPALMSEVAAYAPDAHRRLAVKPGITGLWQVSGRSDLSYTEALSLDLHYTDNWRLIDDLAIAARTVVAVTQARGAY